MKGLALVLIFCTWAVVIWWLISSHQADHRALEAAAPAILRASDINALAGAIGCPQQAVTGDLVKPAIEALTACARAKTFTWQAPLVDAAPAEPSVRAFLNEGEWKRLREIVRQEIDARLTATPSAWPPNCRPVPEMGANVVLCGNSVPPD